MSEIDLLPYHSLGEGKRMQLEREKNFTSDVPDAAYVESLRDVLRGYGFLVK